MVAQTQTTPPEIATTAGVFRAGRRAYDVRASGRRLARITIGGVLRRSLAITVGDGHIITTSRRPGGVVLRDAAGRPLATTTNVTRRTVRVRGRGPNPVHLVRAPWRSRWILADPASASMRFEPHARSRRGPVATVHGTGDPEVAGDLVLVLVGTCLLLARRSIHRRVIGRWDRTRAQLSIRRR